MIFGINTNERFDIFAYFELLLYNSTHVKYNYIETIIVNLVNKIQKVRTNSKFNVKNSIIQNIVFIEFELNFIIFQFRILFYFIKQNFIANINYNRFIKNNNMQI